MNFSLAWDLIKQSVSAWVDDYAPSMGAALAYYTLFSIAPVLIIVIAVGGFFFGEQAARGEIMAQLQGLLGEDGAIAVEGLLESASEPAYGAIATIVSMIVLIIGATTVFAELQSDLDRIWHAPAAENKGGVWGLLRARLLSFGMVLAIGFLLLVSLVASAALSALGKWWGGLFGAWEALLLVFNFVLSFAIITGMFAMIYKILPRVHIAWRDVWIGAAVTALLFTIGKSLVGLYLGKSGIASGFGAAGSIVLLLVWVYYSAQIFLLGAEFTWVYAHEQGSRAQAKPATAAAAPGHAPEAAPQPSSTPPSLQLPTVAPAAQVRKPLAVPIPMPVPAQASGAIGAGLTGKTQAFFREHPIKGLGIVASAGLLIGGVLRRAAPPAKLAPNFLARNPFHRR